MEPSKDSSGLPSLETSKDPSTAALPSPCGLVQTCDYWILENCPNPEKCKTFETAGYCVQPNSVLYPVACRDDCVCLGTDTHYYEYFGFINEWEDNNGEFYLATKVLKHYTGSCEQNGKCHAGNRYSYRILAKLKSDDTTTGCTANCESIISSKGFCLGTMFEYGNES